MVDQEKLLELKRRNRRMHMCKRWHEIGKSLTLDDFIDIHQTYNLFAKIHDHLYEMDINRKSFACSTEVAISEYCKYLRDYLKKEEDYVFFERESSELGALLLTGKRILEDVNFYIQESEMHSKSYIIIICSIDLTSGLCLWTGEYDTKIYVW